MSITILYVADLMGQSTDPRFSNLNNGFSVPPNANVDHSNPNIYRPPARAVGTSVQEPSAISQATWTTPVPPHATPQANVATDLKSISGNHVPFKPPMPTNATNGVKKPSSSWSSTLSMFVSLSLVLAIFFGVAWCLRRVAPQPPRGLSKDVVQVLGRSPIAPRHNMILIRFGRKLVLVSQQLGQTQTLSEIDDPREVDHLLGLCEANNPSSISTSFRDVLYQLASGKGTDRASSHTKSFTIAREG